MDLGRPPVGGAISPGVVVAVVDEPPRGLHTSGNTAGRWAGEDPGSVPPLGAPSGACLGRSIRRCLPMDLPMDFGWQAPAVGPATAPGASFALLSGSERISYHLAKVRVAGSNPVVRSKETAGNSYTFEPSRHRHRRHPNTCRRQERDIVTTVYAKDLVNIEGLAPEPATAPEVRSQQRSSVQPPASPVATFCAQICACSGDASLHISPRLTRCHPNILKAVDRRSVLFCRL